MFVPIISYLYTRFENVFIVTNSIMKFMWIMDSVLTFAKEHFDLISLFVGILGVGIAVVSLIVELKKKRKK